MSLPLRYIIRQLSKLERKREVRYYNFCEFCARLKPFIQATGFVYKEFHIQSVQTMNCDNTVFDSIIEGKVKVFLFTILYFRDTKTFP